jgi:hypothetical protein
VPLGSEYVVSLCDLVWPLIEDEEKEVEKDWNVDRDWLEDILGAYWIEGLLFVVVVVKVSSSTKGMWL